MLVSERGVLISARGVLVSAKRCLCWRGGACIGEGTLISAKGCACFGEGVSKHQPKSIMSNVFGTVELKHCDRNVFA